MLYQSDNLGLSARSEGNHAVRCAAGQKMPGCDIPTVEIGGVGVGSGRQGQADGRGCAAISDVVGVTDEGETSGQGRSICCDGESGFGRYGRCRTTLTFRTGWCGCICGFCSGRVVSPTTQPFSQGNGRQEQRHNNQNNNNNEACYHQARCSFRGF